MDGWNFRSSYIISLSSAQLPSLYKRVELTYFSHMRMKVPVRWHSLMTLGVALGTICYCSGRVWLYAVCISSTSVIIFTRLEPNWKRSLAAAPPKILCIERFLNWTLGAATLNNVAAVVSNLLGMSQSCKAVWRVFALPLRWQSGLAPEQKNPCSLSCCGFIYHVQRRGEKNHTACWTDWKINTGDR